MVYLTLVPGLAKVANFCFSHFLLCLPQTWVFIAVTFNGLEFDMLMYPDHLQNWLDFGHLLLIFLILASFWLNETGQICKFWTFSGNAREEWPDLWHAGVCWPPSELKFWSWSGDFPHFGVILTQWNRSNLGFLAIFFRMHGRKGLKFDMLMYPDYLVNCLHFGHGLLIFIILAVFWLSETRQICSFQAFSWECIGGIGWTKLVISNEMEKANFSIRKLQQGVSLTAV